MGSQRVGRDWATEQQHRSCGRCSRDMTLLVETFILSQSLDTHTKLLFYALSVEVFGVLGMDVIFMGNNLECLENVNVGKKRPCHIWQGALYGFCQRHTPKAPSRVASDPDILLSLPGRHQNRGLRKSDMWETISGVITPGNWDYQTEVWSFKNLVEDCVLLRDSWH